MRKKVELQVDAKAIKDLTNGYPLILKDAIVTNEVAIEEGSLLHLVDKNGGFVGVKGAYRVREVKANNEPLDLNKKYLLGGSAYTIKNGGDGMTMFKGAEIVQDETLSDFDCFRQYITQKLNGVVGENYANPHGEGRIKMYTLSSS